MKTVVIDPNFEIDTKLPEGVNPVYYDVTEPPFALYGVAYDAEGRRFIRMPQKKADAVSGGVAYLVKNTAGGRVRFRTDAKYLVLRMETDDCGSYGHMPRLTTAGFDIFTCESQMVPMTYLSSVIPPANMKGGYRVYVPIKGVMCDYVLNFPLYGHLRSLTLGFAPEARFEAPMPYVNEKPVIFYGSSITQGGCATRPGTCYEAVLSQELHMNYVNYGFSGNAKAEDTMIEYLAAQDMCAFVSDYDHNAPSVQHLANTHEKLYLGIREKHPDIPYVMVSRPIYAHSDRMREELFASGERRARYDIIKATYDRAIRAGDRNVYFVSGYDFFPSVVGGIASVDYTHPNDLGFLYMAAHIGAPLATAMKWDFTRLVPYLSK